MAPLSRVAFGPFVADLRAGELRRDGEIVAIQDLPFRFLTALLERPGEVITRAELTARLWGSETFVDADAGLNTAAAKLRQALRLADDSPLIETIPKRGYRFTGQLAPVLAVPDHSNAAPPAVVQAAAEEPFRPYWRRLARPLAFAAVMLAIAALGFRWTLAGPSPVRVGVVLFDNETGRAELDAFAQRLTDITVAALTANQRLAVIGNAAVLRTDRPFRDVEAIRQAIDADYVIIGQVQNPDQRLRVVTHLIRASDQAHVWIKVTPAVDRSDAEMETAVSAEVAAALAQHAATGR